MSPARQGLHVWPATIADPLFTGLSMWFPITAAEPTRVRSLPLVYSRTRGLFWDPLPATQTESVGVQLEAVSGKDSGAWREEVIVVEMLLGECFLAF
jgi:hypothetical protein